jgi:hypothetical protein
LKYDTALSWEDQIPESNRPHHTSNVLRVFTERLQRVQNTQLLDLGPVCGENINFFARRVKRLFVCDMFLRLDLAYRQGLGTTHVWQHLDYPPPSFDGIMLWGLIDYLNDSELRELLDLCNTMLKPSGTLLAVVQDEFTASSTVNSYVIADNFEVYLRPQPHLSLSLRRRHNRERLAILSPFTPIKSFVSRDGIGEILLQPR